MFPLTVMLSSMGRLLLTELLLLYSLLLISTLSMYCEIVENQTCVVLTVLNKCDVFHILFILRPWKSQNQSGWLELAGLELQCTSPCLFLLTEKGEGGGQQV